MAFEMRVLRDQHNYVTSSIFCLFRSNCKESSKRAALGINSIWRTTVLDILTFKTTRRSQDVLSWKIGRDEARKTRGIGPRASDAEKQEIKNP